MLPKGNLRHHPVCQYAAAFGHYTQDLISPLHIFPPLPSTALLKPPNYRSWRSVALAAVWRGVRRWAWAQQALRAAGGAGTWGQWWEAWRKMAPMSGLGEVSVQQVMEWVVW